MEHLREGRVTLWMWGIGANLDIGPLLRDLGREVLDHVADERGGVDVRELERVL